MGIRELLSDVPIVGELLDVAEIADGVAEMAAGAAAEGYAALREKMEWVEVADGMDTRTAMLAEASEVPPVLGDDGEISAGLWTDPYTGFSSSDPGDFEIDHRVPFKAVSEAVPRFADLSLDEQLAHYNDPDNLQVLHDGHNASKGDALPGDYAETIGDPSMRTRFLSDCSRYMSKLGIQL